MVVTGGTAGTGDDDVTNYQGADGANGSGNYEKSEDRINYEVNRIHKDIKESPYKIRDVGIQALVEPPTANDVNSLTAERQDDIKKILSTIISTSIDKEYTNGQALTQADLENKIVLSVSKLDGKQQPRRKPIKQYSNLGLYCRRCATTCNYRSHYSSCA